MWAWGLAGVFFTLYATLSVRLHRRLLTTGYDLGIFEQAVRSYAHGNLPVSELKGPDFPLLGDHFSPITATIAPLYRIWPSPITLLVVQAALLSLAVVPLTRWAHRAIGRAGALVIGVGYGASWGIAQAVGFDFHEVCFAVPLLAFCLEALGRDRPRTAVAWALPLLLVKEDLGLTVTVVGLLIAHRGHRRLGLATAATGLIGTLVTVLLVIPAFNPGGSYAYLAKVPASSTESGMDLVDLLRQFTIGMVTPEVKLTTLLMLLAPSAFLALRSPLAWLAAPTLIWRFASDNPAYWGTDYHYSAVLMPVVFSAFIDALTRSHRPTRRPDLVGGRRGTLTISAVVTASTLPLFPLGQLADKATWHTGPRVAAAHRILDLVPDGATVSASNRLVPQLTHRCTVTVFGWPVSRSTSAWIVVDTATPQGWPIAPDQERRLLEQSRADGYRTVVESDGYILLRRSAATASSPR
ncbi:DUF2079 domain-containing protein [Streptomyces sp. NPDC057382]|uniref:DUF2079 domain-containing protein n=1 Tax=unclassified Streptomyces TaxID=2593676 RepID=UPI00363CEF12